MCIFLVSTLFGGGGITFLGMFSLKRPIGRVPIRNKKKITTDWLGQKIREKYMPQTDLEQNFLGQHPLPRISAKSYAFIERLYIAVFNMVDVSQHDASKSRKICD